MLNYVLLNGSLIKETMRRYHISFQNRLNKLRQSLDESDEDHDPKLLADHLIKKKKISKFDANVISILTVYRGERSMIGDLSEVFLGMHFDYDDEFLQEALPRLPALLDDVVKNEKKYLKIIEKQNDNYRQTRFVGDNKIEAKNAHIETVSDHRTLETIAEEFNISLYCAERYFGKDEVSLYDLYQIKSTQSPFTNLSLAKALDVKPCTFSRWIHSHAKTPVRHLLPISLYLELPVKSLLTGTIGLMYSFFEAEVEKIFFCLLYTSPSPRD